MAEYALNLWDYWRIVYKRKWIIISILLISIVSAFLFVEKTEPIYKSTVTLYLNPQKTPVAEITGAGVTFWGGTGQNTATQLELIKGYSVMRDVGLKLGGIKPEMDTEQSQRIIAGLRGKISVREDESTGLIYISAMDTDPVRARDIAQTVAEVFMHKQWEDKIKEARNTKEFVQKQLKKLNTSISELNKKLEFMGVEPEGISSGFSSTDIDIRTQLAKLKMELADLRQRYTDNYPGIMNRLASIKIIEEQISQMPEGELVDVPDPSKESMDPERLKMELQINQKLYGLLKERYERALIMEASKTQDIEVVNPPIVPKWPVTGEATVNFMLSGAIGLILGLVAAFIAESLDTSIGTIEDVEEYLRIPVLGVIPQIDIDKNDNTDYWKEAPPPEEKRYYASLVGRLVTQFQPKAPVAEAYRNLQTYIKFSGLDKVGNCIMFTSAGIQEGKTITSVNSALSMAQMGYQVLLIDADLRRPSVHKVFGINREIGLSEGVLGTFQIDDIVKGIDDIMLGNIKSSMIMKTYGMENLHIITSGHLPTNPTEILGSSNMTEFIKEVKQRYQVVLIDSAPVLPVTDSCILSSKVDGVVLVYKAGRVSRGALRRTKLQVENAKGVPIGVVLNSMRASDMKFGSPFYYYYQKYYGADEKEA
ncbi:MAG: AAA family ATPase [Candidatus Tantalella remota]|nr:AAA family ATPase [Candidatus Tantalella remota]